MRDAFLIQKSSDSHKTQSQTKTNIDIIYLHFRKAFDTVQHISFAQPRCLHLKMMVSADSADFSPT